MDENLEIMTEHQMRDALTALVEEMGSQLAAAEYLGVSAPRLNMILHGSRSIGNDVARGLGGWKRVIVFVS